MVTQLKNIIEKFLKSQQKRAQETEKVNTIVEAILDDETKKHTQLAGLYKNNLVLYVDSSAWLFQLNLQKNNILGAIQKKLPDIKTIKIKLGKVNG